MVNIHIHMGKGQNIQVLPGISTYCTYKSMYKTIFYHINDSYVALPLSVHVLCLYFSKPSVFCWWPLSSSLFMFSPTHYSGYSSSGQSGAMLCSWAMAASSFRNSAYSTMANTRLLACGGMGGQGGRTPRGGKARAFFTDPFGRDGSRMRSPSWDWRHSETHGGNVILWSWRCTCFILHPSLHLQLSDNRSEAAGQE